MSMKMKMFLARGAAALSVALLLGAGAQAQSELGANANNPRTAVKDSAMLKPPAGAKVAIIEWEDLECPMCAHSFPIVHATAAQYHVPLVRYDFPLRMHIWSHDAAVFARYLQDAVSPDLAMEYRREVFASQYQIASKDDLDAFTRKFMQKAGKQMPFVIDPSGRYVREVDADEKLGEKMGLQHTPTIFVVTPTHWTEVLDISLLSTALDQAEASEHGAHGAHHGR
jgi:protein-disulfide isomerase